jgi:hypothetical protein
MLTLICQFAVRSIASVSCREVGRLGDKQALAARGKITNGIEKMQTGLTSYTSPAPGCSAPTFCGCWRRP